MCCWWWFSRACVTSCIVPCRLLLVLVCRYGFFNNKRIVLFDTLIKECSEEEVVAVLAHGEQAAGVGRQHVRGRFCCQRQRLRFCLWNKATAAA